MEKNESLNAAVWKKRQGAVVFLTALLMTASLLAYPDVLKKNRAFKELVEVIGGEMGSAELRKAEIAKAVEERHYWGGLLASMNPSLTRWEVNEIGRAVMRYSKIYDLPPKLIVAVIMVESSGRHLAVSPMGAQGLMQVMPFWKEEMDISGDLFDIDTNIRAGTHILAGNIKQWGYKEGLLRYYRGSGYSDDGYFVRVEKAIKKISG